MYPNVRNLNLRYIQPVLVSQKLNGGFRSVVLLYVKLHDVGVVPLPVNSSALLCWHFNWVPAGGVEVFFNNSFDTVA